MLSVYSCSYYNESCVLIQSKTVPDSTEVYLLQADGRTLFDLFYPDQDCHVCNSLRYYDETSDDDLHDVQPDLILYLLFLCDDKRAGDFMQFL